MASLAVELTNLRRLLLSMGSEVELRVGQALDGLLRHDLRSAEAVREGDDPIDQYELDVESECATILALHHPLAGDLRYVIASLRINADLEKIADLARGIAKKVIKMEYLRQVERPPALVDMAHTVRNLLGDVLAALATLDVAQAHRVRGADKSVDQFHKTIMKWAVPQIADGSDEPKALLDVLAIVRSLERISDLCSSIAESVVFAAEGRVVRHTTLESVSGPRSASS